MRAKAEIPAGAFRSPSTSIRTRAGEASVLVLALDLPADHPTGLSQRSIDTGGSRNASSLLCTTPEIPRNDPRCAVFESETHNVGHPIKHVSIRVNHGVLHTPASNPHGAEASIEDCKAEEGKRPPSHIRTPRDPDDILEARFANRKKAAANGRSVEVPPIPRLSEEVENARREILRGLYSVPSPAHPGAPRVPAGRALWLPGDPPSPGMTTSRGCNENVARDEQNAMSRSNPELDVLWTRRGTTTPGSTNGCHGAQGAPCQMSPTEQYEPATATGVLKDLLVDFLCRLPAPIAERLGHAARRLWSGFRGT